jgi:hypothetical protein
MSLGASKRYDFIHQFGRKMGSGHLIEVTAAMSSFGRSVTKSIDLETSHVTYD